MTERPPSADGHHDPNDLTGFGESPFRTEASQLDASRVTNIAPGRNEEAPGIVSSGLFDSKVLLDCLEPVHLVLEFVVDQVPVPLLDHRERRVPTILDTL